MEPMEIFHTIDIMLSI